MMKNNRLTRGAIGVVLLAGAVLCSGCGRGGAGGSDPRSLFEQNLRSMEEFSQAMDQAGTVDQVVAALNQYTREIEKMGPRLKALKTSHPELNSIDESGVFPPEMKDLEDRFGAMGLRMMRAMAKVMQYQDDPRVQAAQEQMMAAAQRFQ